LSSVLAVVHQRFDAVGELAGTLGRHHDQLETVVNDFQAIFYGDAGHAVSQPVCRAVEYGKGTDCRRPAALAPDMQGKPFPIKQLESVRGRADHAVSRVWISSP
jgi:hypothetical protein